MFAPLLSLLLALAGVATSSSLTPPQSAIRECSSYGSGNDTIAGMVEQFADWIETQPGTTVKANMGRASYRKEIDGQCLELLLSDWDCKWDLPVNGAGLAWTVRSIARQCKARDSTGPLGWGYYVDYDTANNYQSMLWANLILCSNWYPKSACGPFYCPEDIIVVNGTRQWINGTTPFRDPRTKCEGTWNTTLA